MDEALRLINDWLYDVGTFLQRYLEALRDDLASDDEVIRKEATEQAKEIIDWLYQPLPPLSPGERRERAVAASESNDMSDEDVVAAMRRALLSTGRARGRPRDETSQQAIRALTLHYATSLSWREIALEVRGCKHTRPNPERSCQSCGEAVRNAAIRLQWFLKRLGLEPDFPKGRELDETSRMELLQLWNGDAK